jgi:hypothetical protein
MAGLSGASLNVGRYMNFQNARLGIPQIKIKVVNLSSRLPNPGLQWEFPPRRFSTPISVEPLPPRKPIYMSSTFKFIKRFGVAFLVVAGLTAMGAIAPRFMKSSDAVKHLTHTMALGSLSVTVTENGAVESSNNKEIKCLVQGGSTVLWVIETGTLVNPGDELVRLDQSKIEDKILQQRIVYETALANKITAESDVAVAEISITEYLEGSYKESRSLVEKEIFEAEYSRVCSWKARNSLSIPPRKTSN